LVAGLGGVQPYRNFILTGLYIPEACAIMLPGTSIGNGGGLEAEMALKRAKLGEAAGARAASWSGTNNAQVASGRVHYEFVSSFKSFCWSRVVDMLQYLLTC
jgi:type IV secretory pathway TrbL component